MTFADLEREIWGPDDDGDVDVAEMLAPVVAVLEHAARALVKASGDQSAQAKASADGLAATLDPVVAVLEDAARALKSASEQSVAANRKTAEELVGVMAEQAATTKQAADDMKAALAEQAAVANKFAKAMQAASDEANASARQMVNDQRDILTDLSKQTKAANEASAKADDARLDAMKAAIAANGDEVRATVSGLVDLVEPIASEIRGHAAAAAEATEAGRANHDNLLAELDRMMADGHERVAKAIAGSGQADVIAMLKDLVVEQRKSTSATGTLLRAVLALTERTVAVETAITAPRMLVTDKDGRPVGVRIGKPE